MGSEPPDSPPVDRWALADVSREIVRLYARYYGRGPTKAKTVWRDEVLVCVLGEVFTRGEEVLVEAGHFDQVRTNRQAFQDAIEPLLRQMIEEATGRRVQSFLSQVSPEGIASAVFVLDQATAG
jgi:uncharacterized protein YbcI